MPRPVEALPCGSRSKIKTFSPTAASAVPRLMAVVVLPTPPFWLAMARTRSPKAPDGVPMRRLSPGSVAKLVRPLGFGMADQHDVRVAFGPAWKQFGAEGPHLASDF